MFHQDLAQENLACGSYEIGGYTLRVRRRAPDNFITPQQQKRVVRQEAEKPRRTGSRRIDCGGHHKLTNFVSNLTNETKIERQRRQREGRFHARQIRRAQREQAEKDRQRMRNQQLESQRQAREREARAQSRQARREQVEQQHEERTNVLQYGAELLEILRLMVNSIHELEPYILGYWPLNYHIHTVSIDPVPTTPHVVSLEEATTSCSICLRDFLEGAEILETTICGHLFHDECINDWLSIGGDSCPLCRQRSINGTPLLEE